MNYEQATKHPMDWIYAHVHAEDRPHLAHAFELVDGGSAGGVNSVAYVGIRWVFGQNIATLGYADEMVKAVKDKDKRDYPEIMLENLKQKLGIRILPGEYDPVKDVIITNPVGEPWPEESAKQDADCYHPTSGLEAVPENWTDARGTFILRAGQQWVVKYYYYVKVA